MRHLKSFAVFFALAAGAAGQGRADFVVPPTGINSVDAAGTALTVTGNYNANSVLTLTGVGSVNLNVYGGPFLVNAAGVVINSGGAYNTPTGGILAGPDGLAFGALLIGNATLGYHQLFATNAANGLGSANPSTMLFTSATLGSIFGAGVSLADGTTLYVKVDDTLRYDNRGSFKISGILTSTVSAVPEPSSIALMGLGAVALVGLKARRKARA